MKVGRHRGRGTGRAAHRPEPARQGHRLVDDAVARGSRPLISGAVLRGGAGYFYEPTVLWTSPDARLLREEIFGPVAPIATFSSDEEGIGAANDTEYGSSPTPTHQPRTGPSMSSSPWRQEWWGLNQGMVSNPAAPSEASSSPHRPEGGYEGLDALRPRPVRGGHLLMTALATLALPGSGSWAATWPQPGAPRIRGAVHNRTSSGPETSWTSLR